MKKTVLVVDDDLRTCNALRTALDLHAFDLVCVTCVREAVQRADQVAPDIFVIELRPAGMCGIELATELRQGDFPSTPMIAISSSWAMLEVATLYDLFQGFLEKPVDLDKLLVLLDTSRGPSGVEGI